MPLNIHSFFMSLHEKKKKKKKNNDATLFPNKTNDSRY